MLRVRLVGGLRLEANGTPLDPPRSRRARGLLAWLALHPGMHSRRALAARFWPDVLDESARTSLRAALTELRGSLAEEAAVLLATREAVGLAEDGVWVDVREVERLARSGCVEEALALGEGELLAGLDDEWALDARSAHAERVGELLERLAADAEAAGRHAEAARRTRTALALDPLSEEIGRRLMRRLAAAGERAGALAAYAELAERLRSELRIAPSAATRALAEEIRRGAAAPAVAAVPPPAALARVNEGPFVGREAELTRLRAAWAAVGERGGRRLVVVAGEPGVGKTHLVLRFAAEVRGEAATVLLGRCSEEPLRPYEPFAEMLAQSGEDPLSAATVSADGAQVDRGDAARAARQRLFDAVDAALADLAGERPLLALIDDLHWADRPTLLLLAALVRSARRAPLLLVATCREADLRRGGELAAALVGLQRDGATDRVGLSGLSHEDVETLARSRLGADEGARIAAAVHARTGGNAFFVEETLRELSSGRATGVPDTVRQAIAVRTARLGAPAQELLAVAAVLGLDVDVRVLQAAAGLPDEAAEVALDELVDTHLLRVGEAGGRVEFPHALVREAVESALNPLRRSRLHRRAADALMALSADRHLEAIAHHLHEAAVPGETDLVVDHLRRAGERAAGMLAYEQAAGFYGRAAAFLRGHGAPEDPRVGSLEVRRGDALLRAGEPDAAAAGFAAAASLARRIGDAGLLARAALGRCGLGVEIIDVDPERVALLDEALDALGERDAVLSSQVLARLAVELYYAPTRDRSEALSARAVTLARRASDARAVAAALNARHVALWRPDRLEERLQAADDMIEAAVAAGERVLELQARNWRVVDLFELGDLDAWRAEVRRHGALADELRLPSFTWYTPLWGAVDAVHRGRWEEARTLRERALAEGRRAGDRNAELSAMMLELQEALLRGDFGSVDPAIFEDRMTSSPAGISWRCGYAWGLAEQGRLDEAAAELGALSADGFAVLPFDANWLSAVGECAETCTILGHAEWARVLYELIAPYAGRPLTAGRALVSYGSCHRHLGGLAATLGRLDDAVAHYEHAIRIDGQAGLRPSVVRTQRALAHALRARGEDDRARQVAATAATEARALGIREPARSA